MIIVYDSYKNEIRPIDQNFPKAVAKMQKMLNIEQGFVRCWGERIQTCDFGSHRYFIKCFEGAVSFEDIASHEGK